MKHRIALLAPATIAPALADTCHFDGRRWVCVQTFGSGETLEQFMLEKYRKDRVSIHFASQAPPITGISAKTCIVR